MTPCVLSKDTVKRGRHYANANAGVKYGDATLPPFSDELALICSAIIVTAYCRRPARTYKAYPLSMPIIPLNPPRRIGLPFQSPSQLALHIALFDRVPFVVLLLPPRDAYLELESVPFIIHLKSYDCQSLGPFRIRKLLQFPFGKEEFARALGIVVLGNIPRLVGRNARSHQEGLPTAHHHMTPQERPLPRLERFDLMAKKLNACVKALEYLVVEPRLTVLCQGHGLMVAQFDSLLEKG